ncbi:TPA: peroxidase-related enzyme [Providencia alcalifaciens]|nr:peroxidase-related enzyme [Providencia alcalifaciens]
MTIKFDLINTILNLTPDSELAKTRAERAVATEDTQAAFEAIFSAPSQILPLNIKYYFALSVAKITGSILLEKYYAELLSTQPIVEITPDITLAEKYLRILTSSPNQADYALTQQFIQQGWSESDIILLAQLITFVTYQSRLVAGLELLIGQNPNSDNKADQHSPITAGNWSHAATTQLGQPSPTAFTQQQLGWESWLSARDVNSLSDNETQTLKKHGQLNSEYFLLLAHQSEILALRTQIDRGIFYTSGGLPRWEREFAAAAVSKVNGCIYCASVHARKASQYAKEHFGDVEKLLATPAGNVLAEGYEPRLLAIVSLVASLSITPIQASVEQVNQLRSLGLTELELLDLIQSSAFFSWANRLMLTLGEPFELPENKE